MALIELWTGLPGSGRLAAALEVAVQAVREGRWTWWVTDSRRRAERIEAALLEHTGAAAGFETVVAGRLAARLLDTEGITASAVSPVLRELLFRSLLQEIEPARVGSVPDSPGWAHQASRFYERLHGGGIESLSRALLRERFPWLDALFRLYDDRLRQAGLVDEADLPRRALQALQDRHAGLPDLLILDRMSAQSVALQALLHHLAGRVDRAFILLDAGDGIPALDAANRQAKTWRGQDHSEREFPSPAPRLQFVRELFAWRGDAAPAPGDLALAYHSDAAAEARWVMDEAARWVHDEHLDESELAIVCADSVEMPPRLRELAPHYGLRVDAPRVWPMAARPLTALALDLLKLRVEGFERERLTSLLVNPLVNYGRLLHHRENTLLLDSAAREAGIRGGWEVFEREWIKPLQDLIARRRIPRLNPDDPAAEERMRRQAEREVNLLADMLNEVRDLVKLVRRLPDPCAPHDLRSWLDNCLRELGVIREMNRAARVDGEFDERLTYGRLTILFDNLERVHSFGKGGKQPLVRIVEIFRQGVYRMTVSLPRRVQCGIPVLSPPDLRGIRPRVLFLLGLSDETWPPKPETDLLQPFSPAVESNPLAETRALLLEASLSAEHVYLSSPVLHEGEHKAAPSPLLEEFRRAGFVRVANPLERDAATDSAGDVKSRIFHSALDLLPEIGRDLTSLDSTRVEVARKRFATAVTLPATVQWSRAWHAIRVEQTRQDPATLTRYEGQLQDTDVGGAITASFRAGRFSPSRLDTYAQCPMKFFHQHVLGIVELEDVEDEVDALTRGSLVHTILAKTVIRLRELRGTDRVDLGENPDQTARVMNEVAEQEFARQQAPSTWWDLLRGEVLDGLINNHPPGRLRALLDAEGSRPELKGESVVKVEAAFGMRSAEGNDVLLSEPLRLERDGETIEFRGRIDRIGLHPDKGWRVWDYKTGTTLPGKDEIFAGISFQLPVYLWALEGAVAAGVIAEGEIERSGYLKVLPARPEIPRLMFMKDFVSASAGLKERIFELRESLLTARFHHPLSQDKSLCPDNDHNPCPYRDACRRDHFLFRQRAIRLQPAALRHAYLFDFQPELLVRREEPA